MYEKSFKSLDESEEYYISRWLEENIGRRYTDWNIVIDDQWWIDMGNGNVGVGMDITVKIFDSSNAFQFELFQIGE